MNYNPIPNPAEGHRRERPDPTLGCSPVSALCPGGELTLDYAPAGLQVDLAMHHLDEGLPLRQRARCEAAFRQLERGVFELRAWMLLNGYAV